MTTTAIILFSALASGAVCYVVGIYVGIHFKEFTEE